MQTRPERGYHHGEQNKHEQPRPRLAHMSPEVRNQDPEYRKAEVSTAFRRPASEKLLRNRPQHGLAADFERFGRDDKIEQIGRELSRVEPCRAAADHVGSEDRK